MTTSSLPVNSPKNFLQTSLSRGRMFSFSSSLVRWMPSSSRVLGRLVSTSPTTCDRNRHHVSSNDSPSVVVQRTRGAKGQEEGSLHWVLFYRESSWQGYQFGFREIFGTYTSNQQWVQQAQLNAHTSHKPGPLKRTVSAAPWCPKSSISPHSGNPLPFLPYLEISQIQRITALEGTKKGHLAVHQLSGWSQAKPSSADSRTLRRRTL